MTGIDNTDTMRIDEAHRPAKTDVECPNCGEGCGGDHEPITVCAVDDEDWPCAIVAAESRGWDKAVAALREAHFVAGDSYAEYLDNVKAEVLGGETT